MISNENTPEKDQKLTWIQWQITNWWWIPLLGSILGFIEALRQTPPYDWGILTWLVLFGAVSIISLFKGIIHDWKEYKNGKLS